ncbi:hypothetical protein VY732_16365 [Pseudomonas sp. ZY71]|uniref:hypothetical protein n=1 Tax=Pseudomonas sp. ZY71 TaxID=3115647 RepID=UPI002F41BB27
MFNKDFLAHNQTAIELKIRKNSGHRLRHIWYRQSPDYSGLCRFWRPEKFPFCQQALSVYCCRSQRHAQNQLLDEGLANNCGVHEHLATRQGT